MHSSSASFFIVCRAWH